LPSNDYKIVIFAFIEKFKMEYKMDYQDLYIKMNLFSFKIQNYWNSMFGFLKVSFGLRLILL